MQDSSIRLPYSCGLKRSNVDCISQLYSSACSLYVGHNNIACGNCYLGSVLPMILLGFYFLHFSKVSNISLDICKQNYFQPNQVIYTYCITTHLVLKLKIIMVLDLISLFVYLLLFIEQYCLESFLAVKTSSQIEFGVILAV